MFSLDKHSSIFPIMTCLSEIHYDCGQTIEAELLVDL